MASSSNGFVGRSIALTWGGSALAGVREKKVSVNGAAIDVSSGENDGYRLLLTVPAQSELNLSLSGITKSSQLRDDKMAGDLTKTVVMTYPDGSIITGTFYLQTYNETGPYNDATTFDCELLSSGEWDYTPPV